MENTETLKRAEIIYKNLVDIIPYARNTIKHSEHQVSLIAGSIKEFGFRNPVIIDKDNVIIAGHGRVLAAEKIGLEKIPCLIADDLIDSQIMAYRIAYNKLATLQRWDDEMLALEIQELDNTDIDLSITGFDPGEIDILTDIKLNNETSDDDTVLDDVDNITKPRGIWDLGGFIMEKNQI